MVWRTAIWTHIFLKILKNVSPLFKNYFTKEKIKKIKRKLASHYFLPGISPPLRAAGESLQKRETLSLSQRILKAQKTTPSFKGWLCPFLSFRMSCALTPSEVYYIILNLDILSSFFCLLSSAHTPHLWWEVLKICKKLHRKVQRHLSQPWVSGIRFASDHSKEIVIHIESSWKDSIQWLTRTFRKELNMLLQCSPWSLKAHLKNNFCEFVEKMKSDDDCERAFKSLMY